MAIEITSSIGLKSSNSSDISHTICNKSGLKASKFLWPIPIYINSEFPNSSLISSNVTIVSISFGNNFTISSS